MTLRVVVGEDQPLVREGIVRVLETGGFEVVAVAGDGPDLVRKASAHKPDIVITDIQMPPDSTDDGLRAALQIRASRPETGVLVLSQFLEDRRVAGGGSALDPEVIQRMVGRRRSDSPIDRLTPRERDVMTFMAEGRSNQGIADELIVTVAAVERHVSNIFSKLGLQAAP